MTFALVESNSVAVPWNVFLIIQGYLHEGPKEPHAYSYPSLKRFFNLKGEPLRSEFAKRPTAYAEIVLDSRHLHQARSAMLEGAKGLEGHLVILFPDELEAQILPHLAKIFKQITLINIHLSESLKTSASQLPNDCQVVMHSWDLTDCDTFIEHEIAEAMREGITKHEDLISRVIKLISTVDLPKFPSRLNSLEKADYVISSLGASQLHSIVDQYQSLLNPPYVRSPLFEQLLDKSKIPLQCKHMRDLFSLVKPTGRICFIDSTSGEMQSHPKKTLFVKEARELMCRTFSILSQSSWAWHCTNIFRPIYKRYDIEHFLLKRANPLNVSVKYSHMQ